MIQQNNRSGFSLVETAVVLLIASLLAAGVMAGAELIRKAQLNTIVEETEMIQKGISSFITTYKALPGDMADASDKLGATLGASAMVNGDGDGIIDGTENIILFQHLAAAGFISGIFDGVTAQPVVGLMASATDSEVTYSIVAASATSEVYIQVSRYVTGVGIGNAAFTPQEAWSIDQKYDDGIPASGVIRGSVGTGNIGNCISGADYDMANDDKACILQFTSKTAPAAVSRTITSQTGCVKADGTYAAENDTRTTENCSDHGFAAASITETCTRRTVDGIVYYSWEVNSGQTCP